MSDCKDALATFVFLLGYGLIVLGVYEAFGRSWQEGCLSLILVMFGLSAGALIYALITMRSNDE